MRTSKWLKVIGLSLLLLSFIGCFGSCFSFCGSVATAPDVSTYEKGSSKAIEEYAKKHGKDASEMTTKEMKEALIDGKKDQVAVSSGFAAASGLGWLLTVASFIAGVSCVVIGMIVGYASKKE